MNLLGSANQDPDALSPMDGAPEREADAIRAPGREPRLSHAAKTPQFLCKAAV